MFHFTVISGSWFIITNYSSIYKNKSLLPQRIVLFNQIFVGLLSKWQLTLCRLVELCLFSIDVVAMSLLALIVGQHQ